MLEERNRYLKVAESCIKNSEVKFCEAKAASKGKKGLVYLVSGDGAPSVLRIYRNPLYFAKTLWVLEKAGKYRLSPVIIEKRWIFNLMPPAFGFILEEFLVPCGEVTRDSELSFIERLARFHRETALFNRFLFRYLWRKWIGKTRGSAEFIKKALPHSGALLERALSFLINSEPFPVLSLCHRDVGMGNAGCKNGELHLFDWDRASYFFPFFELSQAEYFFGLSKEALTVYFRVWELEEDCTSLLKPFQIMFLISRLKKQIKRGTTDRAGEILERISQII